MLEATTEFQFGCKKIHIKMANLSDELSELSHDELQFVIDGFFLWADKTMKQRGINIRSWKAWRRAHPTYCKDYPRIMVEEQIEKMRELIAKAKRLRIR